MKERLLRNPGLKLISVAIAFFLWLMVVSVDDPTITRSFTQVNVELQNTKTLTDEGSYYEVADNTDYITVIATGKRSIIDSLSRDNFRATADVVKRDGNLVPIEVRATKYADVLDSVSTRTQNVKLNIEGLIDDYIDVRVATYGDVATGSILGSVNSDRSVVRVSGPESLINSIDHAVATVDVTGLSNSIVLNSGIQLVDEFDDEIDDDRISVSVSDVNVNVEIWKSKEVPLVYGFVGVPAEGYGLTGESNVDPAMITVAAPSDILASIKDVTIPASAVDISGAMSDLDVSVNISNYLPSGSVLYGAENDVITVHVGVSALLTKSISVPTANISITNIPEGMEAVVAEPNDFVITAVNGITNNFINLDGNTVLGTIDLSGVELLYGEDETTPIDNIYDVPVVFEYPDGVISGENTVIKVLIRNVTAESNTDDTSTEDSETEADADEEKQD